MHSLELAVLCFKVLEAFEFADRYIRVPALPLVIGPDAVLVTASTTGKPIYAHSISKRLGFP